MLRNIVTVLCKHLMLSTNIKKFHFYTKFQIYSHIQDVNYMSVLLRFSPMLFWSATHLLLSQQLWNTITILYGKMYSEGKYITNGYMRNVFKRLYMSLIKVILYFKICVLYFIVTYYITMTATIAISHVYSFLLSFQKWWV